MTQICTDDGGVLRLFFYLCPSVKSVVKKLGLHEHLLQQAAFEGLGVGDLVGHAFDLAVEGGEWDLTTDFTDLHR